jgi:transposase-like protein
MHYSEEEKEKWLEEWRQSGKSIIAFTRENKLVRWTFTKWLKAARSSKAGFVEVTAQTKPERITEPEILIERGGVKIHMPLEFGRDVLRAVLEHGGML